MSDFKGQYEQFFTSPAGISFLTWLQEQRTNEHESAERHPEGARDYSQTAKAYGQVLQHIEAVQEGIGKSRYSSREIERNPQPGTN